MKILVALKKIPVENSVDSVEKLGLFTAFPRISPFLNPYFGMFILLLCRRKHPIIRVTETAFHAYIFSVFDEKVRNQNALDEARGVFPIFLQKFL